VLDREGLEQAACPCYEVSRAALDPLLHPASGAIEHPDEIGARRIARSSETRRSSDTPEVPLAAGARR
jgi:hypothetical protein